jgi:hypothetical protein
MDNTLVESYQFDNDYVVRVSDSIGNSWTFSGVPGTDSMAAAYKAIGVETMDAIRQGIHSEYTMDYVLRSEATK